MTLCSPTSTSRADPPFNAGPRIKHKYDSRTMKGFAAELDDDLKTEFENHPAVKYVGQFSWTPPRGQRRTFALPTVDSR